MYLERMRNLSERQVTIGTIAILFLLILSALALPETEPDTNLVDSIELNYVEGNQLGEAIVQRNSDFPTFIKEPDYRACIYTNKTKPPVILETDTEKVFVSTDRIEVLDVNLSVAEDKLDNEFPREEVNVTLENRCPLRGEKMVVLSKIQQPNDLVSGFS
ncbi:MAG: hypothetical protein BRC29_03925 [Nanohaloarchaea archaeon SW_7_43_1]|nr:MAG: hypothetical protein BRC29_03925 [Nanohaloarchaea archaeon SW_7_43_1]